MPSNEFDTTVQLPQHKDGDPTVRIPTNTPDHEEVVRLPERNSYAVIVGSDLYRDSGATSTAELPAIKQRLTVRQLTRYVTGSRLIQLLFAGNVLVLCAAIGLLAGGLWAANEAGVIPDSIKPDILKSDPVPTKAPDHRKKEQPSPSASSPSNWRLAVQPTTSKPSKKSLSPEVSTSASASVSPPASASASAQPEASPSASQTASSETTAPATTPSPSVPSPTESSIGGEPTSSTSDTATPPTSETASANPVSPTTNPTVTP